MPRVLIVEDSPTQAEMIGLLLAGEGYEVETAANGEEALARMQVALPDIISTDLEMPVMNGLELVEAVRRRYPSLPVVLMTAHGSEQIAVDALRQGAASYVPKDDLEHDLPMILARILSLTGANRYHERALQCLARTEATFVLDNDPALIAPVIAYQDEILARLHFCDATERIRVGVALQEAALNAIYHGNLEMDSELRQQDDEQAFRALYQQRRDQDPYRARRVTFEMYITPAEAVYHIADAGPGFDPSVLPDPTDPASIERIGGRGLLIIRAFMDQVAHNALGNEIILTKRRG